MDEQKSWWQSKTIWAGVIAIVEAIAGIFGISINDTTQKEIVDYIMVVASAISGLLAIYGRVNANKLIR